MSDDGRDRASLALEVWKSSQNVGAERSGVRSIAWLDLSGLHWKSGWLCTWLRRAMITRRCEKINVATTIKLSEEPVKHGVLLKEVPGRNQSRL
jgi:hypothetical protein